MPPVATTTAPLKESPPPPAYALSDTVEAHLRFPGCSRQTLIVVLFTGAARTSVPSGRTTPVPLEPVGAMENWLSSGWGSPTTPAADPIVVMPATSAIDAATASRAVRAERVEKSRRMVASFRPCARRGVPVAVWPATTCAAAPSKRSRRRRLGQTQRAARRGEALGGRAAMLGERRRSARRLHPGTPEGELADQVAVWLLTVPGQVVAPDGTAGRRPDPKRDRDRADVHGVGAATRRGAVSQVTPSQPARRSPSQPPSRTSPIGSRSWHCRCGA